MFDDLLKIIPLVVTIAIAILSLRQEKNRDLRSTDKESNRFGAIAWAIIIITVIAAIAGIGSVIRDRRADDAKDAKISALQTSATTADNKLKGADEKLQKTLAELAESRRQLVMAENEIIQRSSESEHRLREVAIRNAAQLSQQQDLTFVSLLSHTRGPSNAIFEFSTQESGYFYSHLRPKNFRALMLRNIAVTAPLYHFYNIINWASEEPVRVYLTIGDNWRTEDGKDDLGGSSSWMATMLVNSVITRKEVLSTAGFHFIDDKPTLLMAFPPQESQNLFALWKGPNVSEITAEIQIDLQHLNDEDRARLEKEAMGIFRSVTTYYSLDTNNTLCKRCGLTPNVRVLSNGLILTYKGSGNLETVNCPAYFGDWETEFPKKNRSSKD